MCSLLFWLDTVPAGPYIFEQNSVLNIADEWMNIAVKVRVKSDFDLDSPGAAAQVMWKPRSETLSSEWKTTVATWPELVSGGGVVELQNRARERRTIHK